MYKAVRKFTDGENGKAWPPNKGGLAYAPGDMYPKAGFQPTEEHIAYLLGTGNRLGSPCIEAVLDSASTSKPKKKAKAEKEGGANEPGGTAGAAQTPPEPDGQRQG